MRHIVNELLQREPFKSEFRGYQLVTTDNFEELKKGYHIKYITLNEEIKVAGTLIKVVKNDKWSNSYLYVKSNNPWKLMFQKNFIFFKEHISFNKLMRLIANNEINIKINNI